MYAPPTPSDAHVESVINGCRFNHVKKLPVLCDVCKVPPVLDLRSGPVPYEVSTVATILTPSVPPRINPSSSSLRIRATNLTICITRLKSYSEGLLSLIEQSCTELINSGQVCSSQINCPTML